jgi:hypothetical protein
MGAGRHPRRHRPDYPDQIDVEVVHKAPIIGDACGVHVAQLGVDPGVGELDAALLSIDGIGMRADRLPLMRAASSVLMRFASLASRSSMLRQNASRASTVGVSSIEPSPAMCSWQTLPAIRRVSTEAHLQAVACFTEANKHDVVVRRKTTRRCQANEVPLRRGSRAIRFAEHLIGGVPDRTQGLDAVLIPVSAKDLNRVKPEALRVDTNASAAITIARAYAAASKPVAVEPLAGFDDWSKTVREPLVWLGQQDPAKSMEHARQADPSRIAAHELVSLWATCIGVDRNVTAKAVIEIADRDKDHKRFRALLIEQAGSQKGDGIDPVRLGRLLQKENGRVYDNLRIELQPRKGSANRYVLRKTT